MEFLINFSQTFAIAPINNEKTAMNDIRKELRKLGDAVATSLGRIVIAVAVFLAIAIFMRAIYCQPEEHSDVPSCGTSRGSGIPVHLIANPVHKWHPLNVHR